MASLRVGFTIVSALLLVVAVGLGVAWRLENRRLTLTKRLDCVNQQQVISKLKILGTQVAFNRVGDPIEVDFSPRITDQGVAHLRNLPTVRRVNLAYCYKISDKAVEHLRHLPRLEVLKLYRNNPSSHNNFTAGADLKKQPRITDKSLETIAGFSTLKELSLWDNEFSDEGLLKLRAMKGLEKLEFRSSALSRDAVAKLEKSLPSTRIVDGFEQMR